MGRTCPSLAASRCSRLIHHYQRRRRVQPPSVPMLAPSDRQPRTATADSGPPIPVSACHHLIETGPGHFAAHLGTPSPTEAPGCCPDRARVPWDAKSHDLLPPGTMPPPRAWLESGNDPELNRGRRHLWPRRIQARRFAPQVTRLFWSGAEPGAQTRRGLYGGHGYAGTSSIRPCAGRGRQGRSTRAVRPRTSKTLAAASLLLAEAWNWKPTCRSIHLAPP